LERQRWGGGCGGAGVAGGREGGWGRCVGRGVGRGCARVRGCVCVRAAQEKEASERRDWLLQQEQ